MGGQKFQVVGILSKIASGGFGVDINSFVVLPLTSAQQLFGMKSVQAIGVKAIDKDSIPQAIAQVNKELGKYHKSDDFSVVDSSSLVATINQILGVVTLALGGIAAISLVVGGVGIMNIMLVSVTERTREIGLRKAVGAKPQDILIQFLIESVALSVTGGGIGVLIGYLGSLAINQFINTTVTFWSVALAFGVSAAIGIIFGVAPAARASKLNPIEALKYE
jgi:putative ABC transport system permease protein